MAGFADSSAPLPGLQVEPLGFVAMPLLPVQASQLSEQLSAAKSLPEALKQQQPGALRTGLTAVSFRNAGRNRSAQQNSTILSVMSLLVVQAERRCIAEIRQ